jgi:hypothetical protein
MVKGGGGRRLIVGARFGAREKERRAVWGVMR